MNRLKFVLSAILLVIVVYSCTSSRFISDKDYAKQVEADFLAKKEQIPNGNFFTAFDDKNLSSYEREALMFLYAYMPLADITDYSADFHLQNLRASERAKIEMPWGKAVPELFYRHFVLPTRVNNEHLDSARVVFYAELKDRVKALSMKDAILEVNHWCHEKATYTPSDARTSSPLATVRTAYGRCGEESTLLVAALRSVGIPARQVYTPRWAHTDDNHAWVEAWADGQWYFLGACEPEPVLNLAWFNAPASRGMLMHTKVFGRYNGKEEVMSQTPTYTEINVIDNYAKTATKTVKVIDEAGKVVVGALVEFKLYNYSEFYTIAQKTTDDKGLCSLTAGLGDLLVWASKDGKFGFQKLSFAKDGNLTIVLDKDDSSSFDLDLDVTPPSESANMPEVSKAQREENNRRLEQEDSIRNAYISTFVTEEQAKEFVKRNLSTEIGEESIAEIVKFIVASRGNHQVLKDFYKKCVPLGDCTCGDLSQDFLATLTAKDLRDAKLDVLLAEYYCGLGSYYNCDSDNSGFSFANDTEFDEVVSKGLLSTRIYREDLTAYKLFFQKVLSKDILDKYRTQPNELINFCLDSLTLNNNINTRGVYISPEGVWLSRVTDEMSRKIFFVALARSTGLPAWIDPVTNKAQYYFKDKVQDVNFESGVSSQVELGRVKASFQATAINDNPKYYSHFTISRLENGRLQLMKFDEQTTSYESLMKNACELPIGHYVLTTGTRLASGAVMAKISTFEVKKDEETQTELVMRESEDKVQVIGSFNSESLFKDLGSVCSLANGGCRRSVLSVCGRGYYVIGILDTKQEPTNHALRDIALLKDDLEMWGRKMVLLFPDEAEASKFNAQAYGSLPNTIVYGIDTNGIAEQIRTSMKLKHKELLPIFIIADTFNRVVFVSQGYTIGLGEQIKKTVLGL